MNKMMIAALTMMLMMNMAAGYSTAINQTGMTDLENLTRADNIYELTKELNIISDSLIGIFIWLGIMIVSFLATLYISTNAVGALSFATFMGSIMSVLLYFIDLGNVFMIQLSVIGLISSVVIMRLSQ